MAIKTALTEGFGLDYPVVSAPMAQVSGGRLATAVSDAGGLGLVGGGYGRRPGWLREELSAVWTGTERPWGVGLITWRATRETVELALSFEPHTFMRSFGDPAPYVPAINEAGCTLILQVESVKDARRRASGGRLRSRAGHRGRRARRRLRLHAPLVPAVVDAVSPTPVLAAGGIADGRGLAAALMLGAEGALVGTRFYACEESSSHPGAKERLVAASGGDKKRTRVFDVLRGHGWREPYTGRALHNPFLERWEGREEDLAAALDAEAQRFQDATAEGDSDRAMVWSGEGADLIRDVAPAARLLRRMGEETEARLRSARGFPDEVREKTAR